MGIAVLKKDVSLAVYQFFCDMCLLQRSSPAIGFVTGIDIFTFKKRHCGRPHLLAAIPLRQYGITEVDRSQDKLRL